MNERIINFHDAIEEGFEEEFLRNQKIVMLGEDIRKDLTQITMPRLYERFPDRIMNRIPLVEEMLGGIALGMSLGGLKPIIQINWSGFLTLIFDGIYRLGNWRYRMAEKDGPGALIRVGHDGYGTGGAELSISLLASVLHLPNIIIATPASPYHAKGLLKTALRSQQTVVFWEHKRLYQITGNVPQTEYTVPFGSSSIIKPGRDLTLVSWSFTAQIAKYAADELTKYNINAEVIALHTINPIDMKTITASLKKTGRLVIVEEDMLRGGVGGEIGARIVEEQPSVRLARVAAKNVPILAGYYNRLILPDINNVISACKKILE